MSSPGKRRPCALFAFSSLLWYNPVILYFTEVCMNRFLRLLSLLLALLLLPAACLGEDTLFSFSSGGAQDSLVVFHDDPTPSPSPAPEPTPEPSPEPTPDPDIDAPLEVHLLNVACADSILLKKGGMTMLIDAGNLPEAGRITDYLQQLGVTRLDYAMFTHPHGDHVQGFVEVLDAVDVGVFLEPTLYEDYTGEGSDYVKIIHQKLEEKGVPVEIVAHKDSMDFAGAAIRFYQWQKPSAVVNNRSMIEHITYGNSRILLCADIESHAQRALTVELGDALRADIIKLPHHGLAAFTREFCAVVQPKLATISHNRGNERVESLIRALNYRGIDWKLTVDGTIVCTTDGTEWKVTQE